jgi:hypothetical protein
VSLRQIEWSKRTGRPATEAPAPSDYERLSVTKAHFTAFVAIGVLICLAWWYHIYSWVMGQVHSNGPLMEYISIGSMVAIVAYPLLLIAFFLAALLGVVGGALVVFALRYSYPHLGFFLSNKLRT